LTVILDFNRKSSDYIECVSRFFVGESLNMAFLIGGIWKKEDFFL
jgi:hypothetical protein